MNANDYFKSDIHCRRESLRLREILLDMGLRETVKWGKPAYTQDGKNIVLIQNFNKYCALLFPNGNLIDDNKGVLVKTGPKTRLGRQIRFEDGIEENKVRKYVAMAMEVSGK